MAENTIPFVNEAQDATRQFFGAFQGLAETQVDVARRLSAVQQDLFNQAVEVANDQLQLIGKVGDPREYASAQAELVKKHGQQYTDSVKQTVDTVAEAWQAYGERAERAIKTASDKA